MTAYSEPMKVTSATLHATIFFTITVFIVVILMSFLLRVEVVARGEGRVVPVSRVQVIQPEFPGRISEIHVRNGDAVAQGQVLIAFDPTDAVSDLGLVTGEYSRLRIERARVDALVLAISEPITATNVMRYFEVPPDLTQHPYATEQRALLSAEATDFLSAMEQIDARQDANARSEDVTNANIARVDAALEIQSERLATSERLLRQGTTSRSAFLDVQQAFTELERARDVYLKELDQKIAERSALESERRRYVAELRNTLLSRKVDIDARLETLDEEERSARRRAEGVVLHAPTEGIVDQLKVHTIGGVADAGSELMRIVPTGTEIEIEGTFSNLDIGFLEKGQQANIRLHAFPSERFGFVTGEVTDIAADSTETSGGSWGYVVRVSPEASTLVTGSTSYPIRPGMTATLDVTTDKRRLISYFFAPIVQTLQNALGER